MTDLLNCPAIGTYQAYVFGNSSFLKFCFDFLSYDGIYCAKGHFDPPKVRRVKNNLYVI